MPATTHAMAQTADGWVWLGGPSGLQRFDGVRFEKVNLGESADGRSNAVSDLYAPPSGGLAVGLRWGGVVIFKDGEWTRYAGAELARAGRVRQLAEDASQKLWAVTASGVFRFDGQQWQSMSKTWGLESEGVDEIAFDQQGTLWVSTPRRVLYLKAGAPSLVTTDIRLKDEDSSFIQSPDGKLWLISQARAQVLPFQDNTSARDPLTPSRASASRFFDRQGVYWAWPSSVARHVASAVSDVASLDQSISTGMEDREGNIWIASNLPVLFRLRRPVFTTARAERWDVAAPVIGASGRAWFAVAYNPNEKDNGVWTFDTTLRHVQADEIQSVTAIGTDAEGTVWLGGKQGLWRRHADRFESALVLPEAARGLSIRAISPGCAGGLWVSVPSVGLLLHDGTAWHPNGGIDILPPEAPISQACDKDAGLWLGYASGVLAHVTGNQATLYGAKDGLNSGAIQAINASSHGTIVAGERGLAILEDGRFTSLSARDPGLLERATGVVEAPNGDIWVNTARGLSRLHWPAAPRGKPAAGRILQLDLYDRSDGYPGLGTNTPDLVPTTALSSDGKLWITATGTISWIDWTRPYAAQTAPPILIQSLVAGGQRVNKIKDGELASGTRSVEVDYTAFNFSHPERLGFRYRLDGVDGDWVDVGTRRQAYYSNLAPGRYRFRVNVTDETGTWTDSEAELSFYIPPTFVQSRTFRVLCAVAVIALLAVLYRGRIRQLTSRERELSENRLKERERIARDLHDTLLQGAQALVMTVHSAASSSRRGEPTHELLDKAAARAQGVLNEGRDKIQDLRANVQADLATSLTTVGQELSMDSSVRFSLHVEGRARELMPDVLEESYRIAREALLNAFRHSGAASVEAQLVFSDDELRLRVRDDGLGLDEETARLKTRGGHWGLAGMEERANRIGGRLALWSREGAGTEVDLLIPANKAYKHARRTSRWWSGARAGA